MSSSHDSWKEKEAYLEAARRIQVEELQGTEAYYAEANRSCDVGTPQGQTGVGTAGGTPVFTTVFSDGYKVSCASSVSTTTQHIQSRRRNEKGR